MPITLGQNCPTVPADDSLSSALIEAMADGFSVLDASGCHLRVNEALCAMTGFDRSALVGRGPPHPYWPPEEMPRIAKAFEDMEAGGSGPYELIFMRKDGTRFPVRVNPASIERGGVLNYFATVTDLTEQKRREAEVADLQKLVETMMEGGDLATWDWHLVDGWARVSDSYFTLLGYAPGEWDVSYETWAERVHPDDIGEADQNMQALISDEVRLYEAEHRMRAADGSWRWMHARGYVTERTADGKPARVTGTQQNIDAVRSQQDQLRQLQSMEVLGQLTGGIAHDFNNLLSILRANVDLLSMDLEGDARELVDELSEALDRATELPRSLLRHARRAPSQREPVVVESFLNASRHVLRTALSSGIRLEVARGTGLAAIEVDPGALQSALLNLVINARDALARGGTIRVGCRRESVDEAEAGAQGVAPGSYVVLSVEDDGPGMTPDVLARATEPLFTTKSDEDGTGLGLPMVDRVAREAGGFLRLHSAPGEGTTAELRFPAVVQSDLPREHRPPGRTRVLRGTERVLVVDDEGSLARATQRGLRSLGYAVSIATDPAAR